MMFEEGDIGVLPPLGVFDPLGLIETKDMRRWEIMEIKHGRAAMLAFLHVIHVEAGVRFPGYLSGSAQLKFTDVPSGCFASLEAIPKAGWLQILAVALACETGFAARPFGVTKQTDDRAPGDIGAAGWVRYSDPATKAFKLNVERQNGRAAMIGITGCLVHELLGVDALYPTGGLSGAAPPPLIDPETAFSAFPAFSTFLLAVLVLQVQLGARTKEGNPLPNVGAGFNGGRSFIGGSSSTPKAKKSSKKIAALAVDGSRVPGPGTPFAGKVTKGAKTQFFDYDVCTLGGQEGDIGVLPPLGIWDPLGIIGTKDMRRWEIMEIKHGRAAMLTFLHVIHVEAGVRFPGYLSGSAELKFTDVPSGLFASLEAIPKAGWLQILAVALACETG